MYTVGRQRHASTCFALASTLVAEFYQHLIRRGRRLLQRLAQAHRPADRSGRSPVRAGVRRSLRGLHPVSQHHVPRADHPQAVEAICAAAESPAGVTSGILPELERPRPVDRVGIPVRRRTPRRWLNTIIPRLHLMLQIYSGYPGAVTTPARHQRANGGHATAPRDNALEMIDGLTLTSAQPWARQEAITKEIIDITGGAEALAKLQGQLAPQGCSGEWRSQWRAYVQAGPVQVIGPVVDIEFPDGRAARRSIRGSPRVYGRRQEAGWPWKCMQQTGDNCGPLPWRMDATEGLSRRGMDGGNRPAGPIHGSGGGEQCARAASLNVVWRSLSTARAKSTRRRRTSAYSSAVAPPFVRASSQPSRADFSRPA